MNRVSMNTLTNNGSTTQRAYQTNCSMILKGVLKPGERLKIDGPRQRLDTGASIIREALSLLTSNNLVERIDQRGLRTAEASAGSFQEILMLRCRLEDLALRQSILNATSD